MEKHRQKILIAVLGLLLLYFGGEWLLASVLEGPMQKRRNKKASLEKKIDARRRQLASVRKAGTQLEQWRAESLPKSTGPPRRGVFRCVSADIPAIGHNP